MDYSMEYDENLRPHKFADILLNQCKKIDEEKASEIAAFAVGLVNSVINGEFAEDPQLKTYWKAIQAEIVAKIPKS